MTAVADKGLRAGAVGPWSALTLGTASTAPAYSLAATLGFLVIAVGPQAPAVLLVAFLPMLCIAVAYDQLNRADPDCGTVFVWVARAFGPRTGWLGGWGLIAADLVVMANLAQIAGTYSFVVADAAGLGNDLAGDRLWTTVAGVLWIAAMTWMCHRGIQVSARLQAVLLSVELAVLLLFAAVALARAYADGGAGVPSPAWLNPLAVGDLTAFSDGLLLAVFLYWGWDTAAAVNEESADPSRTPGRAGMLSTVLLLATYVLVAVAVQAYAGVGAAGSGLANPQHADDVFAGLGSAVLGGAGAVLLPLAVLISAAASAQTTILPTARATLSMSAHRALPAAFARIHPRHLTPTVSTLGTGAASAALYVGLTLASGAVLADSIASIGLLIAFYYGLIGFACVWYFRRRLTRSVRDLLLRGVVPLAGGLVLLGAFLRSSVDMIAPDYGNTSFHGVGGVFVLGIGALVLGAVLMVVTELAMPDYFRGRTLRP